MRAIRFVAALLVASLGLRLRAMVVECGGESGPEQRAVAELKTYIGLLSEREPDVTFRVGVRYLDLFPGDRALLSGSDGYAVRRKGDVVYIVSPMPRGCLYGVYDFLERNSDIIWARPYEACGTIYTRRKTFEVREADFAEKPVFRLRGWWICGPQNDAPSEYWNARMRCNHGCANTRFPDVVHRSVECGFVISGSNGHNLPRHMPDETFDSHPEYYALVDGERRRKAASAQFCFSNLDGAAVIGSNAVLQIDAKRAAGVPFDVWALMQADNQRTCECDDCRAGIPLPSGGVLTDKDENFLSTRTFLYLNRAMDVVAKAHPDLRVYTLGYQFTASAPSLKLHPNLDVLFCPFIKNDRFSVTNEANAVWKVRSEDWAKATTNVVWREYWGLSMEFPRPHSLVAADDLRWINGALGFTCVCSETQPDTWRTPRNGRPGYDLRPMWDASAMEQWVLSRLMWNPYVPVEAYRDEYVKRTYRKAAKPMRRFYSIIAKSWFGDSAMSFYRDDPCANAAKYIVRPGHGKELLSLLDEAERLAKDEVLATRNLIARQKAHFTGLIGGGGKLEEPMTIPFVGDHDWSKAQTIEGFQRVTAKRTGSMVKALRMAKVSIMHDRKKLYVRFECEDPHPAKPADGNRSEARAEAFPTGDYVEFVLVTDRGRNVHRFAADVTGDRTDMRNGDKGWNAKWKTVAKPTANGYLIGMAIDMESLGIELTQDNRFGACFAHMAPHGGAGGSRELGAWRGVHPECPQAFGEIIVNLE